MLSLTPSPSQREREPAPSPHLPVSPSPHRPIAPSGHNRRMTREAEVLVVGAGPAGSATAAQLARAGRSVLLVDKARFPREKPCAEYASPETETVLRRLGAWTALGAVGVRRLKGIIIVSPSGRRFTSEYLDGGERRWSLAVRRLLLDNILLQHARAAGVECQQGLRVERPLFEDGRVVGVSARRSDGTVKKLRANLVVGADGLQSRLARELVGGHSTAWPSRLGIAAHYRNLEGPAEWAEMYVGAAGYCGLAPLGGGVTTVAAAVPLTRPGRRRAHRDSPTGNSAPASALARLNAALTGQPELLGRLARAERLGPFRGVGPLAWQVPRVAGCGFLLVGDAAGFYDPFTGEGIYRALRGAELAAEAADLVLRDGDWAALPVRYGDLRRAAFAAKERLARLVQLFVSFAPLLDYAAERLARRPELAERLSAALGDFGSPSAPLQPLYLARLLRP